RNLNLALQIMEICPQTVICVNLIDEAARSGIVLDREALEIRFGVPVVFTSAGKGEGMGALMDAVSRVISRSIITHPARIRYPLAVERAVTLLAARLEPLLYDRLSPRWTALRILEDNPQTLAAIAAYLGEDITTSAQLSSALLTARHILEAADLGDSEAFEGAVAASAVVSAEALIGGCITCRGEAKSVLRQKLDRAFTDRLTGIPIMLLMLTLVLWITISGANYPSRLLSSFLFGLETHLTALFVQLGAPDWLHGMLVLGVYRVLAWVVAVMLPPMAIFFPLFTLLEDMGYLPRVAFNLDHVFEKCKTCGKQSLTMCMGFGCNAAGVIGCRIIDS
ncbi:MAG: FeoB small GTPase domain-containing protein, partial [Angelakisella sp.]